MKLKRVLHRGKANNIQLKVTKNNRTFECPVKCVWVSDLKVVDGMHYGIGDDDTLVHVGSDHH